MPDSPSSPIVDALNTAGSVLGVSPTGKPLVNPKVVPWVIISTPVIGALLYGAIPSHTVVGQFLRNPGVMAFLGSLGLGAAAASPGLRKKP